MFRLIWLLILGWLAAGQVGSAQDVGKPRPFLVLDAGGHTDLVHSVLFSRDGREVITISADKTIRIWDATSGAAIRTLRPPIGHDRNGELIAAALSPNGDILAVAGLGLANVSAPIYLIRLSDGQIQGVLRGHTKLISCLTFNSRGDRIASGSNDTTARVWDIATGACLHVLEGHRSFVCGVAFSPKANRLATASLDYTARLWDLNKGEAVHVMHGHQSEVRTIAWSNDGKRLATGGLDETIRLWESNGKLVHVFPATEFKGQIMSLRFMAKDQELLFTTGIGNGGAFRAAVLDLYKLGHVRVAVEHDNLVRAADVCPDGRLAVSTGGNDSETYVWRTDDGQKVSKLVGRSKSNWSAGWNRDGNRIAWGNTSTSRGATRDGSTPLERTFSLETLDLGGRPDSSYGGRLLTLGDMALSFEGNNVYVTRGGDKRALEVPLYPYESVRCGTLLERFAAIGTDFSFHLIDLASGKWVRNFIGHTGTIWSVAVSPNGRYLLSASHDQTLRIWRLDKSTPLLSLFFAGPEWIAWTPEGYYAASPGGEQLMGWHLNNGPDKMATIHFASQFRKTLYRPDVIKLLLKAGSVERALELADDAQGKRIARSEITKVLPPKVRLLSPEKSLAVRESVLEVRARASSSGNHPVTALHLHMDGRPLPMGHFKVESAKHGDVDVSWNITLTPGKHRLAVRAESSVSGAFSEEVEVNYIAPDPGELVRQPTLYVLSIGISDYTDDMKLNYAAKDAQSLAETFQRCSKDLYDKIIVKELIDKKATQREMMQSISWLKKQPAPGDVAVLYFAGHGELASDGSMYLMPADVDPKDLEGTGVGADFIKGLLTSFPCRVILMLDACHAGGVDGSVKRRAAGKSLTDDLMRDLVSDDRGVIMFCAATGKQFALESHEHRHGLFTLALVEGLHGKAAKTTDGVVYLHHLDTYVTDRVRELSQGQQSPTFARPGSVRSFPLSKAAAGGQ